MNLEKIIFIIIVGGAWTYLCINLALGLKMYVEEVKRKRIEREEQRKLKIERRKEMNKRLKDTFETLKQQHPEVFQ